MWPWLCYSLLSQGGGLCSLRNAPLPHGKARSFHTVMLPFHSIRIPNPLKVMDRTEKNVWYNIPHSPSLVNSNQIQELPENYRCPQNSQESPSSCQVPWDAYTASAFLCLLVRVAPLCIAVNFWDVLGRMLKLLWNSKSSFRKYTSEKKYYKSYDTLIGNNWINWGKKNWERCILDPISSDTGKNAPFFNVGGIISPLGCGSFT